MVPCRRAQRLRRRAGSCISVWTSLFRPGDPSSNLYAASFLLPFGSGSAPAAKGVITSMCPSSQRTDALNAITLVENFARLSSLGLFGFIFAALAEVGQAYLTFFCNGVSSLFIVSADLLICTNTLRADHCSHRHARPFVVSLPFPR